MRDEIAALVDPAADLSLGRQPAQEFARHAIEPVNLPSVGRQHQMPRKTFRYLNRSRVAKTFLLECRGERKNAQRRVSHRDGSDHSTEYQPWRRLVFFRRWRPAEPPAADEAAVDADRVGPIDRYLLVRRRIGAQGVGQRHHPGIEGAARGVQWLVGFEHHRKFREIEPPDIDQGTCAARFGDIERVGEGVTAFAQPHQRERRRQIDGFRCERVRAWGR